MNYGMYLSATGVLTNMHRQDVIANNLANASTTGFRRDLAAFTQRLPESRENPGAFGLASDLLDRLGGGTFVRPTQTDFSDGPLTETHNDLDLAISGQGFFAVNVTEDGQTHAALSRDGRLTLTRDGRLVTTTAGHDVLDVNNRPIQLDPRVKVQIDETGVIRQGNTVIAQLKLVDVQDTAKLTHKGFGLYDAPAGAFESDAQARGRVLQGWLEESNVDPISEMVAMIESTRAINNNTSLLRQHDLLNERAVNQLGRLPQG